MKKGCTRCGAPEKKNSLGFSNISYLSGVCMDCVKKAADERGDEGISEIYGMTFEESLEILGIRKKGKRGEKWYTIFATCEETEQVHAWPVQAKNEVEAKEIATKDHKEFFGKTSLRDIQCVLGKWRAG